MRPVKHSLHALILLTALATLPACQSDETLRGFSGDTKVWRVQEIDGAAFPARATLSFPEKGRFAGTAPCNRYFGTIDVPYPWFEARQIGITKMACPDLAAEGLFFAALAEMTLSEVSGDTLILSNDAGQEMVFKAE